MAASEVCQISFLQEITIDKVERKMKLDPSSVPFKRVLKCNIGNPQSLRQKPLSFIRDVLSITLNPSLVFIYVILLH